MTQLGLRVDPIFGTKTVNKSNGRRGYLYCQLLHYSLKFGIHSVMRVRPGEKDMDKWRFANYSREEHPYVAEIKLENQKFADYVLPWLRYETDSWAARVLVQQNGRVTKLRLSFSNPKDAMVFLLYKDDILSGEKLPNRRRRKKK